MTKIAQPPGTFKKLLKSKDIDHWDRIDKFRITPHSKIPEIEPVVKIGDSLFAVRGDISVIGGLPKAGKTAMSVYIIGTALKSMPDYTDTLSIRSTVSTRPIIYIDTEQSRSITNKLQQSILNFIDENEMPPHLKMYNFRGEPKAEDKLKLVKDIFFLLKLDNIEPHLMIIDGLADLVKNPNDITESFGIISEFMAFAENQKTCIIFYLHENPGIGQKLRGNLGSEIERKCFGAITVRKDRQKGFHWIEPRMLRSSKDFENVYFTYDTDLGRMRSLSDSERSDAVKNVDRTVIKSNQLKTLAEMALSGSENGTYEKFWRKIIEFNPKVFGREIKERAAQDKIKEMLKLAIVAKSDNGIYTLSAGAE